MNKEFGQLTHPVPVYGAGVANDLTVPLGHKEAALRMGQIVPKECCTLPELFDKSWLGKGCLQIQPLVKVGERRHKDLKQGG